MSLNSTATSCDLPSASRVISNETFKDFQDETKN